MAFEWSWESLFVLYLGLFTFYLSINFFNVVLRRFSPGFLENGVYLFIALVGVLIFGAFFGINNKNRLNGAVATATILSAEVIPEVTADVLI